MPGVSDGCAVLLLVQIIALLSLSGEWQHLMLGSEGLQVTEAHWGRAHCQIMLHFSLPNSTTSKLYHFQVVLLISKNCAIQLHCMQGLEGGVIWVRTRLAHVMMGRGLGTRLVCTSGYNMNGKCRSHKRQTLGAPEVFPQGIFVQGYRTLLHQAVEDLNGSSTLAFSLQTCSLNSILVHPLMKKENVLLTNLVC